MRREGQRKADAQKYRKAIILPLGAGALLLVGIFAFYNIGTRVPEMDDRLAPKSRVPVGATVLLLDTSDPLTPKHRART